MILEGIITTVDANGKLNVAPMGPSVGADMRRFVLKPFQGSTTYRNLKSLNVGVFHVSDDPLLLANSAIGRDLGWPTIAASQINGRILADACRYYEFRVLNFDDRTERAVVEVETVAEGRFRDFFGWNRAQHAVLEAAILATRTDFLPIEEILAELRRLAVPVAKTGGPAEAAAFALLEAHVAEVAAARDPSTYPEASR